MIRHKVTVKNKTGVHAHPTSLLVKAAKKYDSSVTLIYNDKKIALTGIMGLLTAKIPVGSHIEILCDGHDEKEALRELTHLFHTGFGEP